MKIIIVNYRYYVSGGPEKYMFKFMDLAKTKGHEIIPFSTRDERNVYSEYSEYFAKPTFNFDNKSFITTRKNPFKVVKILIDSFYNFESKRKFKKLIKDTKPDLIYVLIPGYLSSSIYDVAERFKIKTITRISDFRYICGRYNLLRDNQICEKCIMGKNRYAVIHKCVHNSMSASFLRSLSLKFFRIFYSKKVRKLMIPSSHTKNIYMKSRVFSKASYSVNPTFIDCSKIIPNYDAGEYVMCIGRFTDEKGFIYAVEALKYIDDKSIKLVITGNLEDSNVILKRIIEENNLWSQVIFTGFMTDERINEYYKNAICVVVPSIWYENMPNVILEAYAHGKPVIGSNLGSIKEMIDNKITGLLFNPGNSMELAQCIEYLISNPNSTKQMGVNARIKCETEYNAEKHWTNFMEIYNVQN